MNSRIGLCLLTAAVLVPQVALAELVHVDHPRFGPDSVLLDTDTRTLWLRPATTAGYTRRDLTEQTKDGKFAGWRLANLPTLHQFLHSNFGISMNEGSHPRVAQITELYAQVAPSAIVWDSPTSWSGIVEGEYGPAVPGNIDQQIAEIGINSGGISGRPFTAAGTWTEEDEVIMFTSLDRGLWLHRPFTGLCIGDESAGDADGNGICDNVDTCVGDPTWGDSDGDGACDAGLLVARDSAFVADRHDRVAVLSGAPAGATFRLYGSGTGPGTGPCMADAPTACLGLDAPTLLLTATADAKGRAFVVIDDDDLVALGDTVMMQAAWSVPSTGVGEVSPRVGR